MTNRLLLKSVGIYNLTHNRAQRYNAGLHYEHPCWSIGVVYSVNNARKTYANSDLDFRGSTSVKLNFAIKMGK